MARWWRLGVPSASASRLLTFSGGTLATSILIAGPLVLLTERTATRASVPSTKATTSPETTGRGFEEERPRLREGPSGTIIKSRLRRRHEKAPGEKRLVTSRRTP